MISGKISPYFKDKNKANKFGRKTGRSSPDLQKTGSRFICSFILNL